MKKLALAAALFLGLSLVAHAASFTIELTAAQINIIQWKYQERGGAATGHATVQLWFADQVQRLIYEWSEHKASNDAGSFCVAFKAASQAAKNNICAGLGLGAGCAPCQ